MTVLKSDFPSVCTTTVFRKSAISASFPAVTTLSSRDFEKALQILHLLSDAYSAPNLTESNASTQLTEKPIHHPLSESLYNLRVFSYTVPKGRCYCA